jgi:tripartite-type tricarboxylate transporter receptor subunit TctC
MYAETVKVLQMPDIKTIWASQGADAGGQPPAEFAKFVRSEIEKWAKVTKAAGIKVDL